MPYTFDAPKKKIPPIKREAGSPFQNKPIKGVTLSYERALRAIAKNIGRLIEPYTGSEPLDPTDGQSLVQILKSYSELLGPWALHLVTNVFRSVDDADRSAWRDHSKNMSLALRKEINEAPTGITLREIMNQNVVLIKSIPLQAAERVYGLIQENIMKSRRADEIAKMIMETESVTKNRATLIARTEISKASTALTQARALHVGSAGYIWRTSGDMIVRKSHRKLNGVFCKWSEPPLINEGTDEKPNMIAHGPGEIWNCRCWPDVILSEG